MDQKHLDVAIAAARAAAVELMARRDNRVVREKAPRDFVTDADLAAQAAIRSILLEHFPDYAFVGEEEGETTPPESVRRGDKDAPPCWVVDPLDGTVNYVHGLQNFAVSIGLYATGKMRLGVIFDPVADEMFAAVDGSGATVNGRTMRTSGCKKIDEALFSCSFATGVQRDAPEVKRFLRVLEQSLSLRRFGSCALNLCYVADGRLDGYWATSVQPWDAAAGIVIAREAGAAVSRYDGATLDVWDPTFCVSSSEELQKAMIELLVP